MEQGHSWGVSTQTDTGSRRADEAPALPWPRDTLLFKAYGLAARDANSPATPRTVYEIGSRTLPDDSVQVVVFTNSDEIGPEPVAYDLARAVIGVAPTRRGAMDRPRAPRSH